MSTAMRVLREYMQPLYSGQLNWPKSEGEQYLFLNDEINDMSNVDLIRLLDDAGFLKAIK